MTLSIEMALACSSPRAGPTGTWLDRPLTVDVMGATVTFVMAARAASRVRTTAGRTLSRRARRISLTRQSSARRPGDELIEVVGRTLAGEDGRVPYGRAAPRLALERLPDKRGADPGENARAGKPSSSMKVIPGVSGYVESSSSGVVGAGSAGKACSAAGSPARPRPLRPFPSTTLLHPPLYEKKRRSRRRILPTRSPQMPQNGITAAHGPHSLAEAPAPAADRPTDAFPGRSAPAGCPNLPQRPRSDRSARGGSLIFRAFLRGRSRSGVPLWQIWTRPRPGSPQEPHQHHPE